jgi:hypothetical protein
VLRCATCDAPANGEKAGEEVVEVDGRIDVDRGEADAYGDSVRKSCLVEVLELLQLIII